MKPISLYFVVIIFIFFGCKKSDSDVCSQSVKISHEETSRDNFYYYHKSNYSEIIEYYIFKKYGLVDYLQNYPIATDTCFRGEMNKSIEIKLNKKIISLNEEVEKLKEKEEDSVLLNINKGYIFSDGIYGTLANIERPIMKYPMYQTDFKNHLIDVIIKKIDKNYESSSFWIVINKKGEVEKVERYKKHSTIVDDFIEDKLKKTRWIPSLDNKDSIFVSSRIKFMLKAVPQ